MINWPRIFYVLGVFDSWWKRVGSSDPRGFTKRFFCVRVCWGNIDYSGAVWTEHAKYQQRQTNIPSALRCWLGFERNLEGWRSSLSRCNILWKCCKVYQSQVILLETHKHLPEWMLPYFFIIVYFFYLTGSAYVNHIFGFIAEGFICLTQKRWSWSLRKVFYYSIILLLILVLFTGLWN